MKLSDMFGDLDPTELKNQKALSRVSRLIIDEMYERNIPDTEFAKMYGISEKDMEDIRHFEYNPSLMEMIELFDRMDMSLDITAKPKEINTQDKGEVE